MSQSVSAAESVGRNLGSVQLVAQKLGGCSTRHVYRLADGGKMPAPIKLGALVRWDLEVLDAWIAGGCKPCRRSGGAK